MSSGNIVQSGTPSRSALRVAQLRAAHQLLDEPVVFDDPVALPILGPELEAAMRNDPFQFNDPFARGTRATVVLRSLHAEEGLAQAARAGVTQYVVLGAGLDTFAYRNPHAGIQVFEVDHPSTQAWKKQLLSASGIDIPASMKFVAVDFESDSLAGRLRQAGLDSSRPAYLSWLGVALYLSRDAVFDTLRTISAMPKGTAITFDYAVPRSLLNPVERVIGEVMAKAFEAQGEPWISFFDPAELREELVKIGFSATEDVGPAELNARYLARRKDGLQSGGGARLMRATV